jgi:hypothetical protein
MLARAGERGREAVAERYDVRSGLGKTRRRTSETDGAERRAEQRQPGSDGAVPGAYTLLAARCLCRLAVCRGRQGNWSRAEQPC